jgi:hypothetical protein
MRGRGFKKTGGVFVTPVHPKRAKARSFPRKYVRIFSAEHDADAGRSLAVVGEWHYSDRFLASAEEK